LNLEKKNVSLMLLKTGLMRVFNYMAVRFPHDDQLVRFLPTQPISNPGWIFTAVNNCMDLDFIL